MSASEKQLAGALTWVELTVTIDQLPAGAQPIIHSDRDGHYRWPKWVGIVDNAKLTRSMAPRVVA